MDPNNPMDQRRQPAQPPQPQSVQQMQQAQMQPSQSSQQQPPQVQPDSREPMFGSPYSSPQVIQVPALQPQAFANSNSQLPVKKGPNKLVIIVIAGLLLLILLAAAAVIMDIGKKPEPKPAQSSDSSQTQSFTAAQAIDLQQASNAISQDLSSLDDEKDFPAASLEDKTLGL